MVNYLSLTLTVTLLLSGRVTDAADLSTTSDVIVYGSTPGGYCAAIAAAREGASVILLEPTDHVGGLNTGGLSHSDSNQTARETVMGLFDEWHSRIEQDYAQRGITLPYKVSVKDQSIWTYEPHVATRVTLAMLAEAKVTVITESPLRAVTRKDTKLIALHTPKGTFNAEVFVDGTYEGDLMAMAGVDWTIGREGRAEYGESFAGQQYPKKLMNIDGFDKQGNPLPLVTSVSKGSEDAGDKNVMTYSFRLCLTSDPANIVPFPKPKSYNPARFEIMRRYIKVGGRVGFDLYPLPGGKLDGNNSIGGQFSLGLVGGANGWCEADDAGRAKLWEEHKQYTLEFYHFLTTDPTVPERTRSRYAKLGLCKDEFPTYGHFSPALYVREGRRMKGIYVVSQKDILTEPEKEDPIAISSFPIDSHDCRRIALKGGGVINEGTIFPVRKKNPKQGFAYHIPYRSILPKAKECSNLLVPVALSCTHVAISSIRVEPTWMILGQSAGIAAALVAKQNVTVQDLPYPLLRTRLLAQNQVLDLPDQAPPTPHASIDPNSQPGIILDDSAAVLEGEWKHSTNFKPYISKGYVFCGEQNQKSKGNGKTTATFRFKAPVSGTYQVLMAYSAHSSRARNVPVTISSGEHRTQLLVDQTRSIDGGKQFTQLGTAELDATASTVIRISNQATSGFVILDAIQLLPVNAD